MNTLPIKRLDMNPTPKNLLYRSSGSFQIFILLLSCFFLLKTEEVHASHFSGSEISYECLGSNQYRVTLSVYRDCFGASMGTQEFLNISSISCGFSAQPTVNLPLDTFYDVSQTCSSVVNACDNATSTIPGIERYIYSGIISLPQSCTDWVLSWSSCCRNMSVTNLGFNQAAVYIEAGINSTICNNSPVFAASPVAYFCAGRCYEYNPGGYDPDGDSLRYALSCPLQGANNCIPNIAPLHIAQPLITNPAGSLSFDQQTGQMSFCIAASQVQNAVLAVTIYEILNGDTIGYVQRDMQFVILNTPNCTQPVVSISPSVTTGGTFDSLSQTFEVCRGQNLIFETTVYDSEGLRIGLDSLNTNLEFVFGAGNWTVTLDTLAPYRPDSARAFIQINTSNQRLGRHTFTLSFTDNACPIMGRDSRAYHLNVLGVEASITTTGASVGTYCPGVASNIPLQTNGNLSIGGTYAWSQIAGPTISFSSNTLPNTILYLPSTMQDGDSVVVMVTHTAGTCITTDEVIIRTQISPIHLNLLASDTTLCPNGMADTIAFSVLAGNATVNTSNGLYTWTVRPANFAANLINSGTNTPTAILNTVANDTINYQLRYDYGLCADSAQMTLVTRAGRAIVTASLDTVCVGDTVQLMAALTDTAFVFDSSFCLNYRVDTLPFAPITGSGTVVSLGDDALSAALPIGFDFDFYCTTYNQFLISSNGFITFDVAGARIGCCSGQSLPNTDTPNNLIALCWEDLAPNNGGVIDYFTTGTAPNRQLVVRFTNVPRFGGGSLVTAQIVLQEGTNTIDIHSTSISNDGLTTQGIENADGTLGLAPLGRNGAVWSATNDAYRFSPEIGYSFGPISYDWTPSNTLSNSTIDAPTASPLQTTTYEVSINEQGCVRTDSVEIVVTSNLNAPVMTCGFANVPTNSVLFEWGQASGAIAWEYSLDSGATWTASTLNDSSFLYTGLQQGTCYGIWVRALGGTGACLNNTATYLDCCTNVLSNAVNQNGIVLSAVAAGPSIVYQWVDCNNGNALLVGETGQSFTPTVNGDYAVRVEDGVNAVLSTCNTINVTSITALTDAFGLLCYPNPTTGLLQIERTNTELLEIQVLDCLGRVLFTKRTNETQLNLDLTA
ncbi:MAG: Unknown protein, partial [uncultured Aureispira sp.]